MIQASLKKLLDGKSLTDVEAKSAMGEIMSGTATPSQMAAYLVALRMKGETADEIFGCAQMMRESADNMKTSTDVADTCGTGGDHLGTLNVSSASAFVAAGAGVPVAKHGNRAVSSSCGSADVLEELGIKIEMEPETAERCLLEAGMTFLFAPRYHPAMKHVMPTRRELGVRTIFNILGPLANPAGASVQVIGVYDPGLIDTMIEVLKRLGTRAAWVVHGSGLDEISLHGKTLVAELVYGKIRRFEVEASDFGFSSVPLAAVTGSSKKENAEAIRNLLDGKKSGFRDLVVANAAAVIALYFGRPKIPDLLAAVKAAEDSIDSGRAKKVLELMVRVSQAK